MLLDNDIEFGAGDRVIVTDECAYKNLRRKHAIVNSVSVPANRDLRAIGYFVLVDSTKDLILLYEDEIQFPLKQKNIWIDLERRISKISV